MRRTQRWPLRLLILILPFALVLAGCVEDGEQTPSPSTDPGERTGVARPTNATDCTRVFPAIFVDRAHAQSFLPDGYVAAEASTFFGQQSQPAGRAVFVFSAMHCAASDWGPAEYSEAMAGIFIEPPKVDGTEAEGEHFYELARTLPATGPQTATLRGFGWAQVGDAIEVEHSSMPTHSGSLEVRSGTGVVFSASTMGAPVRDDFSGTFHIRWWHETSQGVGFHEYVFTPDGYLGPGSCDAPPGSLASRVMESTTCPNSLFMVGPPFDVEGRFGFVPRDG